MCKVFGKSDAIKQLLFEPTFLIKMHTVTRFIVIDKSIISKDLMLSIHLRNSKIVTLNAQNTKTGSKNYKIKIYISFTYIKNLL